MVHDGTRAAGVELPVTADVAGMFRGEPPAARRTTCQHCGAEIVGRILASLNGAPLCLADRDSDEVSCYRLVSEYHHEMPCSEVPCPGAVFLEHDHG